MGLPAGGVMRVDCGHYVRDLALAASVIGALGLNSAPYAQSLNALANMKKSEVRLGSVAVQAVVGSCYQRRTHLWVQGGALWVQGDAADNCVNPN